MGGTMEKEELFTTAPVNTAVIKLAVPTVISQLITVVYNMADTFFIGQMGDPNQVAAATLSMPIFIFLTAFANLFGIGGASTISRFLGVGNREKAKRTASFCIWSAFAVSVCYGIIIVLLRSKLLPILGTNEATNALCASYVFWTVGVGSAPTVLNAALSNLIRTEGYSAQAGFGVAFGGVLNIVLDPIFIFALGMEIKGAAIATLLSNTAAAAYFFAFLYRNRRVTTITPAPRYYTLGYGIPGEVISVGLPSFIMALMSTLSNLTLNKLIAGYSNEAVAGMGIAKRIDLIAIAIAQGMSQGTLPLIGYNYSAGNLDRMIKALKALLADCMIVAFVGLTVMVFGAKAITQCFISDAATVEYGRQFLRIVALACPTTSVNVLAITVFQATGCRVQPLILSLLRKGGFDIPIMLAANALVGISGIVWATPLADTLAMLVSLAMILPFLKRLKGSLKDPQCGNAS